MAEGLTHYRYYLVIKADAEVQSWYHEPNQKNLAKLANWIATEAGLGQDVALPFEIPTGLLPSDQMHSARTNSDKRPDIEKLVVPLIIPSEVIKTAGFNAFAEQVGRNEKAFSGGGADMAFAGTDHWSPGDAADPIFGNRATANRLLGVDYLQTKSGATGRDVNVVVVDQGLDQSRLGSNYGGGWPVGPINPGTTGRQPGTLRRPHGMMIAHNILQVAPEVTLWDLPLVPLTQSNMPTKISDIPAFLGHAQVAFHDMLDAIADYKNSGARPGPWILVNPWAIFDTKSDLPSSTGHDYINNPNHIFNRLIADIVESGIDVVFGAGNCGQFCPDQRCGGTDRGPGRSIFGANSLHEVLTVGAVRTDEMWLGYSSQGPGQSRLARKKPDLCAPSQFCETDDAFIVNAGTSAACALATGVVAALRSEWYAVSPAQRPPLSPRELKQLLIRTARKPQGLSWNNRLGHGILNAAAAYDELVSTIP